MNILRWRGLSGWSVIVAIILGAGIVVAHRFDAHATPERTVAAKQLPLTGIVRSIPFAQGELMDASEAHAWARSQISREMRKGYCEP